MATQPPSAAYPAPASGQVAVGVPSATAAAGASAPQPPAALAVQGAHMPGASAAAAAAAATMNFATYGPANSLVFTAPDPGLVDDQPTYVNPKQYARILKRRESRKKQTGTDVTSYTPRKRSYMHESRHKHAMQRRRGPGGRFLSKQERADLDKEAEKNGGIVGGTGVEVDVDKVVGGAIGEAPAVDGATGKDV